MKSLSHFSISNLIVTAIIFSFLSTAPLQAQTTVPQDLSSSAFTFEKNLKAGDSSYPDVNYLQYLLDQDQKTIVSEVGIGSADDTSSYYGPRTADAVSRFQSLYASEILSPSGLSSPTGYFGNMTRNKANQLLSTLRSSSSTSSTTNASAVNSVKSATSTTIASTITKNVTSTSSRTANGQSISQASSTPFLVSAAKFTAEENRLINKLSLKIDRQMKNVSNESDKKIVKDQIVARFKETILQSKLQTFLKSSGINASISSAQNSLDHTPKSSSKKDWGQFTDFVQTAFVGPVAYAAGLPKAIDNVNAIIAQSAETPFGGMYLFDIQCTCADDTLNYIDDYSTELVIALLNEPGSSIFYSNFDPYGTYQLGSYGSTNGQSCEIEAGEDCVSISADGIYGKQPGTGTSKVQTNSTICLAK